MLVTAKLNSFLELSPEDLFTVANSSIFMEFGGAIGLISVNNKMGSI